MIKIPYKPRPEGQKDVLRLACEPLERVRAGFIGLGVRAVRAIERFTNLEHAEITAICDLLPRNMENARAILAAAGRPAAAEYSGDDGWRKLCERDDIDLVYISTDWFSHTPMAVYAMECGKHAALEIPAALTVEGCWQLVDTAERTRRHCMMLENCCYDTFELNTLNMVRHGLFGEIVHAEGGYIHDLRERILSNEHGRRAGGWQTKYNTEHTGNPYPTHGLGPLCQKLGIHRGDRMEYLVSMSSRQAGMSEYAAEAFGKDSPQARQAYMLGDMNTSLIMTKRGSTIMLQHDITNPRPYSRIQQITGTKGFAQKYPVEQFVFSPESDLPLDSEAVSGLMKKYEHPVISELGAKAAELCGERARDFIMDHRLVHCLRNGLPLDMDVYDAAEWSCMVELSELSVLNGSVPVGIPDFTRGAWNVLDGLEFA